MTNHWNPSTIAEVYTQPFLPLVHRAYGIHCQHFPDNRMELCTLLSIKTGTCPEDCAYCPQSGHYNTGLQKEKLLPLEVVLEQAQAAKDKGAQRFCMGAAWKHPPKSDFPKVVDMIKGVKALGLETCVTMGSLDEEQALALKQAGLDYYNHNLDTSPRYYEKIITTRTYQDRLNTLALLHQAGIHVCCGGIIGMGESREDRIEFLWQLTQLEAPPESVPINQLIPIPGTPLADVEPLNAFEFIRTIAVARILLPQTMIRLSAGREGMTDEMQALCFMAGANSMFYGDTLLTASNATQEHDLALLETLGMRAGVSH